MLSIVFVLLKLTHLSRLLTDLFQHCSICTQIANFLGPTWGPPGSCRPQIHPMLAPWTLLSYMSYLVSCHHVDTQIISKLVSKTWSWFLRNQRYLKLFSLHLDILTGPGSLRPSDTHLRRWTGSSLVLAMASWTSADLVVNWTNLNKIQIHLKLTSAQW